ncbi:hypothetical protein IEQ34_020765 [Dendrobium chrysotoxum]|uniref:Protein FAR1-RELATED SEQUENCE n=1 Tax=Dendrobium chrysotoxum TaxID=161865 RepID=A0AAV7G304_DENCH|nr:hypothetical protein IEQ34_020765 [Dendrobium chrysotoxum]
MELNFTPTNSPISQTFTKTFDHDCIEMEEWNFLVLQERKWQVVDELVNFKSLFKCLVTTAFIAHRGYEYFRRESPQHILFHYGKIRRMPMKMEIEEDVSLYEQTIFSQGMEAENRYADIHEASSHEAEQLNKAQPEGKFSLSDVYANEKEAYEAYCNYGHNLGFSVRKDHHSFWPNSRKIKSKVFVCSEDIFFFPLAACMMRRREQDVAQDRMMGFRFGVAGEIGVTPPFVSASFVSSPPFVSSPFKQSMMPENCEWQKFETEQAEMFSFTAKWLSVYKTPDILFEFHGCQGQRGRACALAGVGSAGESTRRGQGHWRVSHHGRRATWAGSLAGGQAWAGSSNLGGQCGLISELVGSTGRVEDVKRWSGGTPASGGGLAKSRASGGGPAKCKASGGGPVESRASGGGPAKCRSSGGGPVESRASGGGPAKCRASGGGPAKSRTSGAGSAELRRQAVVRRNSDSGRGGARGQELSLFLLRNRLLQLSS